MASFNPIEASKTYSALDTEELVRVAYLEPNYLPEAKTIALRELDRRGVPRDNAELIERVRADINFRRQSSEMLTFDKLDKLNRIKQRAGGILLIGVLWLFSFIGPASLGGVDSLSTDWMTIALFVAWAAFAVHATLQARGGKPRLLYLVVIVPVGLFLLGLAYRISK